MNEIVCLTITLNNLKLTMFVINFHSSCLSFGIIYLNTKYDVGSIELSDSHQT